MKWCRNNGGQGLTLCDGVMETEGSWISLHKRQPGWRVAGRSFVIAQLGALKLRKQMQKRHGQRRRCSGDERSASGPSPSPALPPEKPSVWRRGSDQAWRLSVRPRSRRCGRPPSVRRCRTRACWSGEGKRLLIKLCDICVRPRGQNRKWSTLMRNLCGGLGWDLIVARHRALTQSSITNITSS